MFDGPDPLSAIRRMVTTAADGMSDNGSRARSACKFVDMFPSRHPGEVSDTIAKADKLLSDQGYAGRRCLGVPDARIRGVDGDIGDLFL